jgi:superfamily II DNA or RNA helicase
MRRRFNRQQKEALYLLAGGKCQRCGVELPNDWHADHIDPFSLGGSTDVINGQALCPTCNLRKGNSRMNHQWPVTYELRLWQGEFLSKYLAEDKNDFLLVATPGAGKTIGSLRVVHDLLNSGIIQRVVVVCPTDHLRNQWLQDATRVNIHLDKLQVGWTGDIAVTTDYIGLVTTYQQVVSKKEQLRKYCSQYKTIVILDEIHHCGDEDKLSWGPAIKHAFSPATRRLLLSGTPFRSDNNPIPFVSYATDPSNPLMRSCVPDFSYGYGDALKDDFVVRHIVFPGWDGKFVWEDFFGEEKEASFETALPKEESARRLRTAIHAEGQAIRKVIQLANDKLTYIRSEEKHETAGGLIVAQDQAAAYELARIVEEISGEKAVVAVSDDENASANIDKFRSGKQRWIVAVKMVSEGVDIKRLRIGVYATNVLTRTFFRQVIGRVIRWDSSWNNRLDDQTAWFYVPEDPELVRLMKEVKEEIVDVIIEQEKKDAEDRKNKQKVATSIQMPLSGYQFRHSEGDEKNHYFNGHSFPLNELQEAERFFAELAPGFERIAAAPKALFLRNLKDRMGSPSPDGAHITHSSASSIDNVPATKHGQKTLLQRQAAKKVSALVHICQQRGLYIPGTPHQVVNRAWGRRSNYSHASTIEQLEKKITWLEGLIQRVIQGDRTVITELING